MIEVELKYRLLPGFDLRGAVQTLAATPEDSVRQVDLYFQHPARDFAVTDEAFRIRSVGEANLVTYKGPLLDQVSKTRKEIEVSLQDGETTREQMIALITALGFVPCRPVVKLRQEYRGQILGQAITLAHDRVEGLGEFVELEQLAEESAWEPVRDALVALAARLGFTQPEHRSYLQLLRSAEVVPGDEA